MAMYTAAGSGSSGSTTYNQYTTFGEYTGSTYATNGFTIDLRSTFSSINHFRMVPKTIGSLPNVQYRFHLNNPGNGRLKVELYLKSYDRLSSIGNVQNQPSGVTVQAASGATSSSESSHTHAIDHNHASFTSGNNVAAGAGVLDQVLGTSIGTHTHDLDLPNLTGTSGAGSSHSHADNSIYAHTHVETRATTDATRTEMANGTSLSSVTWLFMASGVRA